MFFFGGKKPSRNRLSYLGSQGELEDAVGGVGKSQSVLSSKELIQNLNALESRFGAQVYSTFLRIHFHIHMDPPAAKENWEKLVDHHKRFQAKLGSGVDFRVSFLDYLVQQRLLEDPTILDQPKYQELHKDTITDELTGLFNARHFHREMNRELHRARRHAHSCSLLFLDLDHFKKLNDTFGHLLGDEVLRRVAEEITTTIRSMDLAFRYGGEEFLVMAPQTSIEGMLFLAERIRKGVAAIHIINIQDAKLGLTVSGGISSFPLDGDSGEDLLKKADHALYRAKENGRNRIEIYNADQRTRPRQDVRMPVIVSLPSETKQIFATKNASENGLLLEMSAPVAIGSVIDVEFSLSAKETPIRCAGLVTRLHPRPGLEIYEVGVSIMRISQADLFRYRNFLSCKTSAQA